MKRKSAFFKQIYTSRNTNPNDSEVIEFFNAENALSEETAKTCEGVMSVDECERALMTMESNKTPGTDGLTSEFYRYFWNAVNKYMVDSFNYGLQHRSLSISQRQGIIQVLSL